MSTDPRDPDWPDSLRRLAGSEEGIPEAWLLLATKLRTHVLAHCRREGRHLEPEDLEDLVSEKALDLVTRIVSGKWTPEAMSPGEIVNYVHRTARNGVIDFYRGKRVRRDARDRVEEVAEKMIGRDPAPSEMVEAHRFSRALADCVGRLDERGQKIWYYRVFLEMSSKNIATHPEVQLKPSHVDVLLGRSREKIRNCMESKRLPSHQIPPGAFAEIWSRLRSMHREGQS